MQAFARRLVILGAFLFATACGASPVEPTTTPVPSETPAPTAVPTNTATPTPEPIPGISEPLLVNDVSVLVLDAGWEDPAVVGASVEAGYQSLRITLELSGGEGGPGDVMTQLAFRDIAVLDENGNESHSGFFNLLFGASDKPDATEIEFFFGIPEGATPVTIRFADGQTVELAGLLKE